MTGDRIAMIKTIVIIYDQAYISGGAAKIAIKSAISLKKKGYRVVFFAALGPIDEELINEGIEVVCTGGSHIGKTKNPRALLKAIWNVEAKRKLDELLGKLDVKSTVVHIHGWTKCLSSSVFEACYKNNMRTFITLHEYFTICPNGGVYNYKKGKICDIKPNGIRCLFCNCDKRNYLQKIYRDVRQLFLNVTLKKTKPNVIYITEFSKNILKPFLNFPKHEFYLENHVEFPHRSKVKIKDNKKYLFIGRMSGEKAPELFCEAITRANVEGIVIGAGPQLERLRDKYENIQFTGWLSSDEMGKYINQARCLIVSSKWYETMGLTVLEMQARGIPCIVPDRCAASEYVEHKKNGLIYKIGNISSLINAINVTKDDKLIEKWGDYFYDHFDEQRYSMERHINELIDIYNF